MLGPRSRIRRPVLGAVQAPEAKSVLAMGSVRDQPMGLALRA